MNETLWLIGSLTVFVFSISGLYSANNMNSPFVGENKKGYVELFIAGSRNQYGIEGFLIGFMLFAIGGCLVGFTYLLKYKTSDSTYLLIKYLAMGLLFHLCTNVLHKLEEVFRSKNFYNPSFFPPDYYTKGSYYTDQGIIQ